MSATTNMSGCFVCRLLLERHEECDCWLSLQNLVVYLLAILRISTGVSSARIVQFRAPSRILAVERPYE
ncbi:Protein argonaute [Trichinella spiralis]|uniref:Protein argonaute n=1 Tax=Trichinella spiralis TaxID=6334 RepID=A0ABR3KIH3_TRISP